MSMYETVRTCAQALLIAITVGLALSFAFGIPVVLMVQYKAYLDRKNRERRNPKVTP